MSEKPQNIIEELAAIKKQVAALQGTKPPTFEEVDSDGSGSISPQEFNAFVDKTHKTDRNRQIGGLISQIVNVVFLALLLFTR